MKTILEYLDDLKEKNGSDYRTAKMLNLSKEGISKIRSRGKTGDDTAIKMADLLGVDRTEVLIAAAIARSEGEVKKSWENISKHMGIAASITLASALMLGNSSYGTDFDLIHSTTDSVYYVKSNVIIGGISLALAMILTVWSRKNGIEKNELLSHAQ